MNYHLQPYRGMQTRHHCPQCKHHSKSFVRYVNIETGAELATHVGRCNRFDKCGYHYNPRKYYLDSGYKPWTADGVTFNRNFDAISHPNDRQHRQWLRDNRLEYTPPSPKPVKTIQQYIDGHDVDSSYNNYDNNNFVQYLIKRFGYDKANELVGKYRIGTSNHWPGATIFWQIDTENYARTGKIMLYDKETGKRVKAPFNHITWAHSLLMKHKTDIDFQLNQCLFGEHLLADLPEPTPRKKGTPIALVESEKTAIIASATMPQFIWLACGSLNGLNPIKCRILRGRQIMLFPDVNAYALWQKQARLMQQMLPGSTITVSPVLEELATDQDRQNGVDLADVLG
ncbi:DUF6371 domain-containing protein [Mucilaginibacter jinjuensis]|uniref:DUF6371 domain-containing protein n=1 Tax=Mucilaginibacter jinjuensis TaxID=1176721 RepID=A0ABY7TBE6_9SPHI|nr:DUF6371 domain-containing protein [Mucilaginibacter jinjuensis]WCT13509.1 DUF6371 domain-containing protein [Mucilaginibacter jinjuensis]